MLEKLAEVPVSTWNYKAEGVSVRHIGPMAQDLYAAFKLGGSEEAISTTDGDGLSLAAIQGLYAMVKDKEADMAAITKENEVIKSRLQQVERLQQENAVLRERLAALEARVAATVDQLPMRSATLRPAVRGGWLRLWAA